MSHSSQTAQDRQRRSTTRRGSSIQTYLYKKSNNNSKMSHLSQDNSTGPQPSSPLNDTDILRLDPAMAGKMLLLFANYIRDNDRGEEVEHMTPEDNDPGVTESVLSQLLSLGSEAGDRDVTRESCSLCDEDKIAILARSGKSTAGSIPSRRNTNCSGVTTGGSKPPLRDKNGSGCTTSNGVNDKRRLRGLLDGVKNQNTNESVKNSNGKDRKRQSEKHSSSGPRMVHKSQAELNRFDTDSGVSSCPEIKCSSKTNPRSDLHEQNNKNQRFQCGFGRSRGKRKHSPIAHNVHSRNSHLSGGDNDKLLTGGETHALVKLEPQKSQKSHTSTLQRPQATEVKDKELSPDTLRHLYDICKLLQMQKVCKSQAKGKLAPFTVKKPPSGKRSGRRSVCKNMRRRRVEKKEPVATCVNSNKVEVSSPSISESLQCQSSAEVSSSESSTSSASETSECTSSAYTDSVSPTVKILSTALAVDERCPSSASSVSLASPCSVSLVRPSSVSFTSNCSCKPIARARSGARKDSSSDSLSILEMPHGPVIVTSKRHGKRRTFATTQDLGLRYISKNVRSDKMYDLLKDISQKRRQVSELTEQYGEGIEDRIVLQHFHGDVTKSKNPVNESPTLEVKEKAELSYNTTWNQKQEQRDSTFNFGPEKHRDSRLKSNLENHRDSRQKRSPEKRRESRALPDPDKHRGSRDQPAVERYRGSRVQPPAEKHRSARLQPNDEKRWESSRQPGLVKHRNARLQSAPEKHREPEVEPVPEKHSNSIAQPTPENQRDSRPRQPSMRCLSRHNRESLIDLNRQFKHFRIDNPFIEFPSWIPCMTSSIGDRSRKAHEESQSPGFEEYESCMSASTECTYRGKTGQCADQAGSKLKVSNSPRHDIFISNTRVNPELIAKLLTGKSSLRAGKSTVLGGKSSVLGGGEHSKKLAVDRNCKNAVGGMRASFKQILWPQVKTIFTTMLVMFGSFLVVLYIK